MNIHFIHWIIEGALILYALGLSSVMVFMLRISLQSGASRLKPGALGATLKEARGLVSEGITRDAAAKSAVSHLLFGANQISRFIKAAAATTGMVGVLVTTSMTVAQAGGAAADTSLLSKALMTTGAALGIVLLATVLETALRVGARSLVARVRAKLELTTFARLPIIENGTRRWPVIPENYHQENYRRPDHA